MDDDEGASPQFHEYVSAYEQAATDHDWLAELSDEWISNASSEPSEQGSARGMSVRGAFGTGGRKIDTIPEETETSTIRIVLGETDVHNTPDWKRHLDDAKSAKDLFSPCHLEDLFKEDTSRSRRPSQPASPNVKTSTSKEISLTNTAAFLKDITDNISITSPKKPQQSPLRQVYNLEDMSSPILPDQRPTTGSTTSGKSTFRSSDEKSTHESSDDSSLGDPDEDLSIAEPTQPLIDSFSFHTARPEGDEITIHTNLEFQESQTPESHGEESFQTAKLMQTPHPNAMNSLNSSTELRSRSVRFAASPLPHEPSFSFNFTPQPPVESVESPVSPSKPPVESSIDIERPQTPSQQHSSKNTPHNSPLKLFSRYDTFTNNKLEDMVANLLPKPDDDDDLTSSRQRKRARREALSRDRVPRLPQNHEIRHNRMASLTTQEMVDDAEDFMRDLRSMAPRPIAETEVEEEADIADQSGVVDEANLTEEDFGASTIDEGNVSSDFDDHPQQHVEYSQLSESEAYDSIRQVDSPGKLTALPYSPGKGIQPSQLAPSNASNANPTSRVSSAESMQVITPDDVSHLLQTTVGSMTFDRARNAWYKIRASQMQHRKSQEDSLPLSVPEVEEELPPQEDDDEEEDIFRDIDDLVVSDEEEESNLGSRPTSSGSEEGGMDTNWAQQSQPGEVYQDGDNKNAYSSVHEDDLYTSAQGEQTYISDEEEEVEEDRMSPGHKERGSAHEYNPEDHHEPEDHEQEQEDQETNDVVPQINPLAPKSPVIPPKSPERKSISVSPMPSPLAPPRKSQHNLAPSPLRKPLGLSIHGENVATNKPLGSPMRSPHRKTLSTDKKNRKSIPLPALNTPEAIRQQAQMKMSSPARSVNRRSQYEHLMATPQTTKIIVQPASPFLEPRECLRLSISPPPADISFANTPRQDVSFSVTTRVLVKHLTDFEPFEPYWEKLKSIDFRDKGVTSLDGLKSFCPKVEALDIKNCKVKYLTGLPSSIKVLKASGNRLGGLVSFAWATNLQYLDLANNEIDSLAGLSSLIHLRELRVDNNSLSSLDGILQLDGLLRISAKQNQISSLEFTDARLTRLEVLECQKNCIGWVEGLEQLTNLMSLHLDDNNITTLQPKQPLRSLRTLKVCRNELESFDPKLYPELRTLYLDENQIRALSGIRRLRLLENFSARSQRGETTIGIQGLSELRKVYLSGIPVSLHLERPFYNLQYLELAAIKLQALPKDFASKVPNVRILNLSFNSLKDVTPIKGMTLLKRLFLIGNRLSSLSDGTTETLLSLTELQVLDLRLNPITLSFYPPVEAKKSDHHRDMFSLVTGRQAQSTWQQRDKEFKNAMPRSWELRRKAYQGLVYTACPKLRWFDGSEVSRGSVAEGERVLKSLEGIVSSVRSSKRGGKK